MGGVRRSGVLGSAGGALRRGGKKLALGGSLEERGVFVVYAKRTISQRGLGRVFGGGLQRKVSWEAGGGIYKKGSAQGELGQTCIMVRDSGTRREKGASRRSMFCSSSSLKMKSISLRKRGISGRLARRGVLLPVVGEKRKDWKRVWGVGKVSSRRCALEVKKGRWESCRAVKIRKREKGMGGGRRTRNLLLCPVRVFFSTGGRNHRGKLLSV